MGFGRMAAAWDARAEFEATGPGEPRPRAAAGGPACPINHTCGDELARRRMRSHACKHAHARACGRLAGLVALLSLTVAQHGCAAGLSMSGGSGVSAEE